MSEYRALDIAGAWEIVPDTYGTETRSLVDICRFSELTRQTGTAFQSAQMLVAVSARGVLRGIHYAAGQAKVATCVQGEVLDVLVDLRTDSPTFGRWSGVVLNDVNRHAVYVTPGLGHGYCALSATTTMVYLLSPGFDVDQEREISPFDPQVGIVWPDMELIVSDRDTNAPTLAAALAAGRLPGAVG